MTNENVTAAILVIGDEILSGRTKDKNVGHMAELLTLRGIDLREVRFVPDVQDEIVAAVNALRARWTYVFTTGGIGPTHDDITADAIAAAFGVGIDVDPRARALLLERIKPEDLNEARLRMARIPFGAELVENPVSKAPGFRMENVFVMAGVPSIMQAMFDNILPQLKGGAPVLSVEIDTGVKEGDLAAPLGALQAAFADVSMGSYPSYFDGRFSTRIVLRSRDADRLAEAETEARAMVAGLTGAS
ncbi:MAG: competence/damage-inducible protein A [Rhodobiaceae bacterium]|nr:competence/damage-inducible protein A [Rhodobiaceae bacterium]